VSFAPIGEEEIFEQWCLAHGPWIVVAQQLSAGCSGLSRHMPDVRENDPVQMCCQGQVHETCMRGARVACEKGNKDEKSGRGADSR